MKIVNHSKPKFLVAENVINILSKKFKVDFDKWIKRLDDMGYNTYYKKINSRDFGVPQNRERVFCVSIRKDIDDGSFQFSKSIPLNRTLLDLLEDNVGDEYYLEDDWKDKLIYRDDNQTIVDNKLKIKNATAQGYLFAKHGDGVDTAYATSKTRRGRVQEARIQTLTTKYKNYTVLICEESNPTEESFKLRFLTPLEYWRAMGIRDEDYLKAKKSGVSDFCLYNQAGNAIVVDVLSHIFQKIVDMYYK
jgi:DNA (cytosine-5)-methyltransferase 1